MARRWKIRPGSRPHECEYRSRIVVALAELDRQSARAQYVLIARVFRLLDPRQEICRPSQRDPRADPLLGTLPVTPPE